MHLLYKWINRSNVDQSSAVREADVSRDELHVRKLVDATIMSNVLYEHTSNAYEDAEVIYVEPTDEKKHLLPKEGQQVYGLTAEYYDISQGYSRLVQTRTFEDAASLATRLLDHYTVLAGRDYQLVYTILDEDRGAVLIFVQPE
ncbi:hypothetical protein [Brevibacillus dissolubilis]|uniref:hypothetical protein n=1 Tax=Brevibacillus dissolubilis TaxID=1844116 RepID=UPI001115C69E|nr:hypothetical protein [Brevibacillus dissolubilis]